MFALEWIPDYLLKEKMGSIHMRRAINTSEKHDTNAYCNIFFEGTWKRQTNTRRKNRTIPVSFNQGEYDRMGCKDGLKSDRGG